MKRSLIAFFFAAGLAAPGAFSLSAFAQESLPAASGCPFSHPTNAAEVVEATLPSTPDDEVPSFRELLDMRAAWADEAAALPDASPAPAAAIDDAPVAEVAPAADVAPVMDAAEEAEPVEFDFGDSAAPPAPTDEPADAPALEAEGPAMAADEAAPAPVEAEPALEAPSAVAPAAEPSLDADAIAEIVGDAPPAPIDEPAMEEEAAGSEEAVASPVAEGADLPCRLPEQAAIEAAAVEESPRPAVGRGLAARIAATGRNALFGFGEFLASFGGGSRGIDAPQTRVEVGVVINSEGVHADVAIEEVAPADEAALEPVSPFPVDEPAMSEALAGDAPEASAPAAIDEFATESELDLSIEALIVGVTAEAVGSGVVSNLDAPAIRDALLDEAANAAETPEAAPAIEAPLVASETEPASEPAAPEAAVAPAAEVAAEAAPAMEAEVASDAVPSLPAELAAEAVAPIEGVVNPFDAAAASGLAEMFEDDAPPAPESIAEPAPASEEEPAAEAGPSFEVEPAIEPSEEQAMEALEIEAGEFDELKRGLDG